MAPQIVQQTQEALPTAENRTNRSSSSDKDHIPAEQAKDVSDDASSYKQEGVQQVEAITTVWTKQVLIVMFVLYVHHQILCPPSFSRAAPQRPPSLFPSLLVPSSLNLCC